MSTPTAEERKNLRLAKLFDLRTFIGALFIIFGVLVTIQGIFASDADIKKAAGIRLALWLGLVMLAMGLAFVSWTLASPPDVPVPHDPDDPEDKDPEPRRGH